MNVLSKYVARFLERHGLLKRDMEQSYLTLEEGDDPMAQIHGHSITYRIAVGLQYGQTVFTLPSSDNESNEAQIGQLAGSSLHAGIMARRD